MTINIVIVASGEGTRLKPMTDLVPKCLIPYKGKALLLHQLEAYKHLDAKFWLIANSRYKPLLDLFCKNNKLSIGLLWHDKPDGSANAIASTCQHLANTNVLFQWCDLIVKAGPWLNRKFNTVGLTARDLTKRFVYNPHSKRLIKPIKPATGNIPGVYLLANYEPIDTNVKALDLADLSIEYAPAYIEYIDIGDKSKWLKTYSKGEYATETLDGTWIKKYDDEAQKIKEANWYLKHDAEKVVGQSYKTLELAPAKGIQLRYRCRAYKALLAQVRANADIAYIAESGNYYLSETKLKLKSRIAKSNIKYLDTYEAVLLMHRACSIIGSYAHAIMRNGHFDLNSYNVFVSRNWLGKYSFDYIDPRAEFANKPFGPLAYETSKIYYGLMIWPALNELNEIDLLNKKNVKALCLLPLARLKAEMTTLELAWCCVHLLTAFGKFADNPVLERLAFEYGILIASYLLKDLAY